jgi:hypothetical protein
MNVIASEAWQSKVVKYEIATSPIKNTGSSQ